MVIGKDVSFSYDVINTYLSVPLALEEGELDEYAKRLARRCWNINLVSDTRVLSGKSYETSASGALKNFLRKNLNNKPQAMMTLVLLNIMPKSHTFSVPLNTAYLLYYILDDMQMNVARIISNEIKMTAESGHRLGRRNPRTLDFPGLIMGLCMSA